jgi:hypothetical protein
MQGDGHTYKDGFSRYGTISPRLANDVSRLAVHCGWSGVIKIAAEPDGKGHLIRNSGKDKDNFHIIMTKHTYYKISIIRKQNQPFINKKVNDSNEEKLIVYEGKVYCIEMPSSHLYYMRENNFAPSMLIGNSRAGQKGTLGLIIPEKDMPFAPDGTRPDLIINPHAIPSRMTIGQIVESLFGKACAIYGGFGDCTAFQVKGSNYDTYAPMLTKAGFHSSGKQLMYNGMSGEQIEADIFMGPTYYMRLKHMVKDKINYRARGPNTNLTRQPVQGRANDGGLRIGEMERDGVLAHGMSYFLNESFMVRGDEYHNVAVCNKTGAIAVYNKSKNLFFSLFSDGPISFHTNPDGSQNVKNVSKFGRSFSILRVPYALKLLIQELEVLNIQMRLITDDNVDQLLNMSYSNNISKLLKIEEPKDTTDYSKTITKEYYKEIFEKWTKFQSKTGPALEAGEFNLILKNKYEKIPNLALLNKSKEKQPIEKIIDTYIQDVKATLTKQKTMVGVPDESPELPSPDKDSPLPPVPPNSLDSQYSPPYAPNSPAYNPDLPSPLPLAPDNTPDSQSSNPDLYTSLKIDIPQNATSSDSSEALSAAPAAPAAPVENDSILEVETKPVEDLKTEASNSNNNGNDSRKIILSNDANKDISEK